MTTIAFDGKNIVSDTLIVDEWGFKNTTLEKMWVNENVVIGIAGKFGRNKLWLNKLPKNVNINYFLENGFSDYIEETNDPPIMIIERCSKKIYRHVTGCFIEVDRPFFAIGSGRDFAMTALYLGKTAKEAVIITSKFDIYTNHEIVEIVI